MKVQIEASWKEQLKKEFVSPYFLTLTNFLENEYRSKTIYPQKEMIFNAFDKCPYDKVKVVIIGQDPYHGPGQAHGLCFSVNEGIKPPPSLNNIFKELESDLGISTPTSGNLTRWAEQGVLLLNATLTVEAHKAGAHQKKGWETFTDAVIKNVSDYHNNIVFILWGGYAQKKGGVIDSTKHHIIKSAHPSPLSAYNGFWGSKPFSQTNKYLKRIGKTTIEW